MANMFTRFILVTVLGMALSTRAAAQAGDQPAAYAWESGDSSATAPAEEASSEAAPQGAATEETGEKDAIEKRANLGLVLGLKLGGNFSGVFSDLGTSYVSELEIGYLLPLPQPIGRDIEIFVTGQYTQPSVDGKTTAADPRLPGNHIMSYDVTQQELILTLGALYVIPIPGKAGEYFRPYASLGGRLYLMRSLIEAKSAGQDFGKNEETATKPGFYGALGGDLFLGPGAAFLELQFVYAGLNGFVMRDTNVGAMNLAVGYRLII